MAESVFLVPPAWTLETGFPLKVGIPELWDTVVPVISGACTNPVCSSLPRHGPGKTVSVPGCCKSTHCFADMPYGPRHGSRLRKRLTDLEFQRPRGVSTPSHLKLSLQISRSFRVHIYYFAYGQEYCLILVHLIHSLLHHV